jgi:hypothetical protein
MKSHSLLALVLIAFVSGAHSQSIWKESKNPAWKSATGVEQYERLMWKAVKDKDWLAVESHMASNFVYQDASGTKDKAQRLAELKSSPIGDEAMSDLLVTPSGEHAIVTYAMGGRKIMSVWQQQKSGWVMVAMATSK